MIRAVCILMMNLTIVLGFQPAIMVGHFRQHREALAAEFCVNADQTELQCEGLCYLKKQLEKTGDTDSNRSAYPHVDLWMSALPTVDPIGNPVNVRHASSDRHCAYQSPFLAVAVPPPMPLFDGRDPSRHLVC